MTTKCSTERLEFGRLRRQRVAGRFDGGELGSDGGGLLLRELGLRTGLFQRLSACFRDYRDPQRRRHAVEVLVATRVLGIALGYEDLNDALRQTKLWSLLCGTAGRRSRGTSWQELPPGKSTLNRMELTGPALLAAALQSIVASRRGVRRDHCVWRAAGPAKQAAITLDLAVQPARAFARIRSPTRLGEAIQTLPADQTPQNL